MARFIPISRLQDYHTSPAEEAAILAEVYSEHPSAYQCILVDGGVMVFDTAGDFETWGEQA